MTWVYCPRAGWCLPLNVAGVVVKTTKTRVHIRVRHLKKGDVIRAVRPESLRKKPQG